MRCLLKCCFCSEILGLLLFLHGFVTNPLHFTNGRGNMPAGDATGAMSTEVRTCISAEGSMP